MLHVYVHVSAAMLSSILGVSAAQASIENQCSIPNPNPYLGSRPRSRLAYLTSYVAVPLALINLACPWFWRNQSHFYGFAAPYSVSPCARHFTPAPSYPPAWSLSGSRWESRKLEGARDHRVIGSQAHWIKGSYDHGTIGSQDHRSVGS
jgi:hypothetical protein